VKIVFFGTSSFSVTILEHLLASPHQVIGIVTRPDKPQGRALRLMPPPVKEWAAVHASQIPLYQPVKASSDEFIALMEGLKADVFVVAAYGQILKTALLNAARQGSINVHASLLPKWRGAAPIQRSLMVGERESGVTIMQMVLELDAGDILDMEKVEVPEEMTHGELERALALMGGVSLLRVLGRLEKGEVKGIVQDKREVTFAPKITPEDTEIDWSKDGEVIHNQIRALSPEPGAWSWVMVSGQKKKMKIKRSRLVVRDGEEREERSVPGQTVSLTSREWVVRCGKGELLSLVEVQLEGKRVLPIADFLRGFRIPPQIV
jgi:methionyl-tRNA formyltransferase